MPAVRSVAVRSVAVRSVAVRKILEEETNSRHVMTVLLPNNRALLRAKAGAARNKRESLYM